MVRYQRVLEGQSSGESPYPKTRGAGPREFLRYAGHGASRDPPRRFRGSTVRALDFCTCREAVFWRIAKRIAAPNTIPKPTRKKTLFSMTRLDKLTTLN